MDIKRIMSGLLGFPLVVIIFLIGNKYIVDVLLTIVAILAINEYFNAISKICTPVKWVGYLSTFSISLIHLISQTHLNIIVTLSVPTILLILFLNIIVTDMKVTLKDISYTFLGIFYIIFFMMFIAFINGMPNGNILIWYAIFAAWGTDVSAYFIGKHFGKHKFSKVSPKKSLEGCLGGIVGSIIMILVYTYFANNHWGMNYSYTYITIIGIILSIVGQIGDFSASAIKRYVNIKDYSNLIPGHGGMLDRIDSLLFIAPFAYALFILLL